VAVTSGEVHWAKTADGIVTLGVVLRVQAQFSVADLADIPADEVSDTLLGGLEDAIADLDTSMRSERWWWPGKRPSDDGVQDVDLRFERLDSMPLPVPPRLALAPLDGEISIEG
jgi:hypothetical protein